MIKKTIYDAILVPKPESSLDMDAVGLLVSMANELIVGTECSNKGKTACTIRGVN